MRELSDKERAALQEKIGQEQTERRRRIGQLHGWRKLCPKCTKLGLRPTGGRKGASVAYRCSYCGHMVWSVDNQSVD